MLRCFVPFSFIHRLSWLLGQIVLKWDTVLLWCWGMMNWLWWRGRMRLAEYRPAIRTCHSDYCHDIRDQAEHRVQDYVSCEEGFFDSGGSNIRSWFNGRQEFSCRGELKLWDSPLSILADCEWLSTFKQTFEPSKGGTFKQDFQIRFSKSALSWSNDPRLMSQTVEKIQADSNSQ